MSLKSELRVGVSQRQLAFGQDCKAIIPIRDIDGMFLALAMKVRSNKILSMVDEAGHGTGRLPTDLISQLEIAVPLRISEQRRIAEILDTVENQIRLSKRVLGKLEALRVGIIREELLSGFRGENSTVGALFDIKAGITLGPHRRPRRSGCKYLRVANVQRGWIDLSDMTSLEASPAERQALQLCEGDLLVVEGRESRRDRSLRVCERRGRRASVSKPPVQTSISYGRTSLR